MTEAHRQQAVVFGEAEGVGMFHVPPRRPRGGLHLHDQDVVVHPDGVHHATLEQNLGGYKKQEIETSGKRMKKQKFLPFLISLSRGESGRITMYPLTNSLVSM